MPSLTITYNQHDLLLLQKNLQVLSVSELFTEISTKKCLYTIPGLVSRSFQCLTLIQHDGIPSIFNNALPLWIKYGMKSVEESPSFINNKNGNLIQYKWHSLRWKTDVSRKYVAVTYENGNKMMELRLTQECLDKYFLISTHHAGNHMIIVSLKTAPRCYNILLNRRRKYQRILNFGEIDDICLSNISAICLQFMDKESLDICKNFLQNIIKLDCHFGSINCVGVSSQTQNFDDIVSDFWSSYAFQMLLTLGYRIKKQIKRLTLRKIHQLSDLSRDEQYPKHQCYSKLLALYYKVRYNRFCDINEEFDQIQSILPSTMMDKWMYVPRAYLTPYALIPLPVKPIRGNRVLREQELFGPAENFCRLIIRDVDLGLPQQDFMCITEEWIKNLIIGKNSITIGNRQFICLLFSNSQLRDKSFWFHAPHSGRTAEDIRQWMGDFSHEKCVGTRIARMALSLTGTTPTIKLLPHQMECIEDKVDSQGRIFTDGVGKISPEALTQALMAYDSKLIDEDNMPCVIQARLNGIKGVFALANDLKDRGVLIQYRPSQNKFKVDHNILEIIKHSSSGMAFLNRQVIVLLENMGVSEDIFLKLQNKTRINISMSLLANGSAQRTLEQNIRLYDWGRMRTSGIPLTEEPFVRSLLLLLAQERLKKLKEKSHVQIPLSDGRMLLGVVDETDSLEYGEVFIQLRDLNGQRETLHNRKILITKNPAHHPGDIRILNAVDRPALHHLYDCVVFPAKGERPHPNEISGSDLDGDEYWTCWNEDLINNATKQYAPAIFNSAEKVKHNGDITMSTIADFLFEYLSSDSLGVLSNLHLACCAVYGANHEYSRTLAGIISEVVDFPKTGVLPKAPSNINIKQYPDFMENKYRESFESDSSLGIMYRQIKDVLEAHLKWQIIFEEQNIVINPDFIIEGYEDYIIEAEEDYKYYTSRINTILSIYNLENEYELITGCHSCPEEEKRNNDSAETALLEFRYLVQEMRNKFGKDKLSYTAQLRKASACYYVAYKAGTILSFGWIMDRLMSAIMKRKQILREEHQAWKSIGSALYNQQLDTQIKELASELQIEDTDLAGSSKTEILGHQFLKIIERYNQTDTALESTNILLRMLHTIAIKKF
ncbi:unnamed protein product [Adineta steineri]|uniref:RNA-dependent RNA polymerase n=1 Tax=Adineta steineri TaxID=433720 RepID=A0A818JDQ7_9BILA|nr:unnamed protein product [Adineta steineri]CAF3534219.1 unnamed protein product [Adineta steineri]